jgi:hypothetical protein
MMEINGYELKPGADLRGTDLYGANLRGADLYGADLYGADLYGANLRGANLRGANLRDANLYSADLRGANLRGANLRGANLRGAHLYSANLRDADLRGAKLPHFQIPEGVLVGWKKVEGKIVQLEIPFKAKRTGSLVGRKCRASFAYVKDIERGKRAMTRGLDYTIGKTVYPDNYDDDIRVECTHGIHFFLTRKEAEEW